MASLLAAEVEAAQRAVMEPLAELSDWELRKKCGQAGLDVAGNKRELIVRLARYEFNKTYPNGFVTPPSSPSTGRQEIKFTRTRASSIDPPKDPQPASPSSPNSPKLSAPRSPISGDRRPRSKTMGEIRTPVSGAPEVNPEHEPTDEDRLNDIKASLEEVGEFDLRRQIGAAGLEPTGKREELINRLARHILGLRQIQQSATTTKAEEASEERIRGRLRGMSITQLRQSANEKGLEVAGNKEELIDRIMNAVTERSQDRDKRMNEAELKKKVQKKVLKDIMALDELQLRVRAARLGLEVAGDRHDLVVRIAKHETAIAFKAIDDNGEERVS